VAGIDGHCYVMRIQDVLQEFYYRVMSAAIRGEHERTVFELEVDEAGDDFRDEENGEPRPVSLTGMIGTGDEGNRCLTLRLRTDD
jgi:hypothetical protein